MPYYKVFKNTHLKKRIEDLHGNNTFSDILLYTTSSTFLFDYNFQIYGGHFKYPSFSNPPKPMKFIIRKYESVDSIFVSHSESMGVLFTKNIKIYMTRPVYEQIILRYEKYRNIRVTYEEEVDNEDSHKTHQICSIDDVNIEEFKRNVSFINYNQIVSYEGYSIQSKSSGTFIGWCNFIISFPSKQTLFILTSFSEKRRFTTEAELIKSDYLIVNRPNHQLTSPEEACHSILEETCHSILEETSIKRFKLSDNDRASTGTINDIEVFSKYIKNYSKTSNKPVLVPVEFETFFVELLVHILSIVEPFLVPITVISSIFTKLNIILNVQSEWLNKDFFTIQEPFPVTKYSKFNLADSLIGIKYSKNIAFCHFEEYDLMREYLQDKFDILLVNPARNRLRSDEMTGARSGASAVTGYIPSSGGIQRNKQENDLPGLTPRSTESTTEILLFNLKIEASNEELLKDYKGRLLDFSEGYLPGEIENDWIFVNSNLPVINNKIVLTGRLIHSDFKTPEGTRKTLIDEKVTLKGNLEEEAPVYYEGWFYLIKSKIKFKVDGDSIQILKMK